MEAQNKTEEPETITLQLYVLKKVDDKEECYHPACARAHRVKLPMQIGLAIESTNNNRAITQTHCNEDYDKRQN